jgi:membrane protease YdiL (CAAX protease family)
MSTSQFEPPADSGTGGQTPAYERPTLRAGNATLIFVGFLAPQLVVGFIAGMILVAMTFMAMPENGDVPDQEILFANAVTVMVPAVTIGYVAGAITMIALARRLVRDQLKDVSPTGAAWVLGKPKHLAIGLILGALVALICLIGFDRVVPTKPLPEGFNVDLVREMPAFRTLQLIMIVVVVVMAPLFEELLFRGVLLGGYRRSWGPVRGGALVTILFAAIHFPQVVLYWPSIITYLLMALAALWIRLKASAVGPAVMVHLAYNMTVVIISATALSNGT